MADSRVVGLILVVAGGVAQGAFIAPSKWIRNWNWENYWLVFSLTSYLILPWSLALFTIPKLFEIYASCTMADIFSVALFGLAWGLGALTFGLGVEALGMSLGFAIIMAVATIFGTLVPLIFLAPPTFSPRQLFSTILSLCVMLAGAVLCSLAGKWKETSISPAIRYGRGVLICVASGVLSSGGNLGLSFAGAITKRALQLGVSDAIAPNALWTLLTVPLFLCNSGFALLRLRKHRTGANYVVASSGRNLVLAVSMGVLWMGGLALYGAGARKLGPLGTAPGFAIFMSCTVLVACMVGALTGEWRGSPERARRQMLLGIILLLVAIYLLASVNR